MTLIAHDAEKLRALNDETRRAWSAYSERLAELAGEEYERAEDESWDQLQRELLRLERRRRNLSHVER